MTKPEAIEKLGEILDGLKDYPEGSPEERLAFHIARGVQSSKLDDSFAQTMLAIDTAREGLRTCGVRP